MIILGCYAKINSANYNQIYVKIYIYIHSRTHMHTKAHRETDTTKTQHLSWRNVSAISLFKMPPARKHAKLMIKMYIIENIKQ